MVPVSSLAIIVALALMLFSSPGLAGDGDGLKPQVQALLDQAAKAIEAGDVQAVLATSAPGATIQYRDGRTMTMDQWAEGVSKDLADWKDVKSAYVVEKAWPTGPDQAKAVYSERHEFSRVSDPGHQHAIAAHFEALLTKTPQGWRFQKFIEQDTQILRDGKAVAPQPK